LLGLSTIYEESKYLDYCVPSAFYNGSGPITTCQDGQAGYDYTNRPFNNVPKWAGNLSYQHTFTLPNGATLIPALNSRFKSRYTAGNVTEVLPSYTNSNAMLTYAAVQNRWSAMLFVRNIENKPDYTSSSTLMVPTLDLRTLVPPRTYGIRLAFAY
jgi:iron complex outermembrane recepter protein